MQPIMVYNRIMGKTTNVCGIWNELSLHKRTR